MDSVEEVPLKQVTPSGRRSSRAVAIPEDVQKPMRRRLLRIRQSRQIPRNMIESLGAQTVRKNEEEDLTSMRMGDLYGLSVEYNISLQELIEYIVGKVDTGTTAEDRRLHRMTVYLRSLPEDLQEVACDIIQRLVVHHTEEDTTKSLRRDSRSSLKYALEEREGDDDEG